MFKPILGISMGDPFGNGPEITVRALADEAVYDRCKPLVVGDETSMRYALKVAEKVNGIKLDLNVVKTPAEGKYTHGTIDLLDLGLVPAESIPDTSDLDEPKPFKVGACAIGGETTELAYRLVMIHNGFAIVLWPVSFVFPNMLRACNDVKYPMRIAIFSMVVFRIGFSYILGVRFGMGALGVWYAMLLDWVFRSICFVGRYLHGDWKRAISR